MNPPETDPTLVFLLLLAGVATVAVLWWRGCLRADALVDGPDRRVGLRMADLWVAVGLMLLGMSAYPLVARAWAPIDLQHGGFLPGTPTAVQAGWVLLGQLLTQGPVAGFLLVRAATVAGGLRRIGFVPRQPGRELVQAGLGLVSGAVLVFCTMLAAVALGEALGRPAPELGHDLLATFRDSDSLLATLLLAVAVAVVAPVLEETIYRGLVQTLLLEALGPGRRWAIVMAAAGLFAVIHGGAVAVHALPGLFVLGVVLGWLYEKSGSLWPSIAVHAGFNVINAAVVVLSGP